MGANPQVERCGSGTTPARRAPGSEGRPTALGKFLWRGGAKLYLRGVTYGPFRPNNSLEYPTPELVARDFSMMSAAGVNAVRVYTVPPRWLLDLSAQHGLLALCGL